VEQDGRSWHRRSAPRILLESDGCAAGDDGVEKNHSLIWRLSTMLSKEEVTVINSIFILISFCALFASGFLIMLIEIASMIVEHQIMPHVFHDLVSIMEVCGTIEVVEWMMLDRNDC